MSPLRSFLDATHGDRASDAGTYLALGFGSLATGLDLVAQAVPGAPHALSSLGVVPLMIVSAFTAFRIWQGNVREAESNRHKERIIELRIEEELSKRQDVSPVHVRVGMPIETAEMDKLADGDESGQ